MNNRPCVIYFIGAGAFVKIGKSSIGSLDKRLSAVQIGCPFPAELIGFFECEPSREKLLHRQLKESHFRGEWFRKTPEVEALLKKVRSIDEAGRKEAWRKFIANYEPPQWTPPAFVRPQPNPRHMRQTPDWMLRKKPSAASSRGLSVGGEAQLDCANAPTPTPHTEWHTERTGSA